jgi:hypothetical protein
MKAVRQVTSGLARARGYFIAGGKQLAVIGLKRETKAEANELQRGTLMIKIYGCDSARLVGVDSIDVIGNPTVTWKVTTNPEATRLVLIVPQASTTQSGSLSRVLIFDVSSPL